MLLAKECGDVLDDADRALRAAAADLAAAAFETGWRGEPSRSAARRTKTSISKKQNEKITAAMALGPVRLSLRIATTASS